MYLCSDMLKPFYNNVVFFIFCNLIIFQNYFGEVTYGYFRTRNFKITETLYIVPLFFSDKLTGEKMAMLLWLGHKTMPPPAPYTHTVC